MQVNTKSDHDYPCCSIFGCGKILTLQEQLHGNKCINHQKQKPLDQPKQNRRDINDKLPQRW
jgi:hypothetical protein